MALWLHRQKIAVVTTKYVNTKVIGVHSRIQSENLVVHVLMLATIVDVIEWIVDCFPEDESEPFLMACCDSE